MPWMECSLCAKGNQTVDMLNLLIATDEPGRMRNLLVCQACAKQITPALQRFLAAIRDLAEEEN